MRKFIVLLVLVSATVGLAGSAAADVIGPSNSDFVGGDVICGSDPNNFISGPLTIYNFEDGLEVCVDGSGSNPGLRVFILNQPPIGDLSGLLLHGDIDKDTPIIGMSAHFLHLDLPF